MQEAPPSSRVESRWLAGAAVVAVVVLESAISLVTIVVVASRAFDILGS